MKKSFLGVMIGVGMALATSAFTLNPFDAGTVYVAKTGSDSTGDGSEAKPYLTVQKGVDSCPANGTVVIGDGDYSDVGAEIASNQTADKKLGTVVNITKRIRLTSKNGKAKTRIVGTWSTQNLNGFEGVGEGAVRCITVATSSDGADAVLIDNLTITHGGVINTTANNKNDDNGAGVYCTVHTTNVMVNDRAYVVDCDITDCRAGIGAAIGRAVCPIRCLIARNAAYQGSQVFYRSCHAYNCVFAGNGATGTGLRNTGNGLFTNVQPTLAVNCTFLGNFVEAVCKPNDSNDGVHQLYNCCALGSAAIGDGNLLFSASAAKRGTLVNSVQTHVTANGSPSRTGIVSFQYRSPATGDWAMLSGGALRDAGSDDHYLPTWVPEEYQNTDFRGKPRKVGAHVDIGAIECQGEDDAFALADAVHGFLYCAPSTRARKGDEVVEPGFWTMPENARCLRVTSVYNEAIFFGYYLR